MKNILVALDLPFASARPALDFARGLAEGAGGTLWLLHVAAPDSAFASLEAGPPSSREARAQTLRVEHRELHELAERLRTEGFDAHALIAEGVTPDVILDQAERRGVELVVLGSHGHGALRKALLGSTSDAVLRRSRIPVAVVPDPRPAPGVD